MRHALTWFAFAAVLLAEGPVEVRLSNRPRPDVTGDAGPSMLRANVNWIRVPVHVTDESGRPLAGLARADFALFEDGVAQDIRHASIEETPVSIGIVFDASSSMKEKLAEARAALPALFQRALTGDEYSLIEFGNEPRLVEPFTREPADIERAAAGIRLTTWTALYDAVYLGVAQSRQGANARKALLVLSDGADNNSRYSESELRRYAQETDVEIYTIAIRSSSRHAAMLRRLAEATGGVSLEVGNTNELDGAISKISRLMRSEYVLDYVSNQALPGRDGLYRRIEVRVGRPGVRAAWRRGYYAPQSY